MYKNLLGYNRAAIVEIFSDRNLSKSEQEKEVNDESESKPEGSGITILKIILYIFYIYPSDLQ